MFAHFESFLRNWRQRYSRSEWAIRHLGLPPSEGTSEEPGILLLQIDGFARTQLERAIARGRMPYLRRLRRREGYELHDFYPGLPTTTPAVQAELYYGIRTAVPAFSFYDRARKRLGMMFYPDWAKEFEATYQEKAEGLLKGGSCWSNIYTGGAGQKESHFCAASIGFGDMWRTGKIWNIFLFILLQFPAALRIARLLIVEAFVAFSDVIDGVRKGEKFWLEFAMAISRIFIGLGLRELVTIGGKVDLTRGLPIVHINFLAYDEHAHRRGPGSRFAHYSLRAIDRSIKDLCRAARHSRRRDYSVWIFSDHGQERVRSFALEVPGGVERVIRDCMDWSQKNGHVQVRSQRRLSPPWLSRSKRAMDRLERHELLNTLTDDEQASFTVAAVGPVGHVYFSQRLDDGKRLDLARRLVSAGRIPGVLLRAGDGAITWFHQRGEARVPDDVSALLPHPLPVRAEIGRDLVALCENANAGDLVLLGWSPWEKPWTFAPERGAHGGPGPEETRGFALLPARSVLPPGTEHFIRPSALRAAALHLLGRAPLPRSERASSVTNQRSLRLMTYNVHSCAGMDGRTSPRRVARVISAHNPDIVALQELDLGKQRSRSEDQAAMIARELGMEVIFCPTVTRDGEHYGHALLSRWPIEVVRRSILPADKGSWWKEPRAAVWGRIQLGNLRINIITAHLGLSNRERWLQMEALLGDGWLTGIPPEEPVVLCGDFNLMPGSKPYGLAAKRLRDAQMGRAGHRPLPTFSSTKPFVRIDHIFISSHLETRHVFVPRNELTRVASDHLPLVADLQIGRSNGDTPTRTPP